MEGRPCIDENQKLQLILKNLEHEWDFIKKRSEKTIHRTSSASSKMTKTLYRTSSASSKMTKTLDLLNEDSPRKLMYSLQQKMISPPLMDEEEVAWKVRTNDLAVEEMLGERRAAVESGKLKGRRLFEEVEDVEVRSVFSYESDNNYEDEINWPRKQHLSPSYPLCSYSSSSCGAESGSGAEEKEIGCDDIDVGSGRVRLNFVISLVLLVLGIIAFWSFGVYEDEEVILTPT